MQKKENDKHFINPIDKDTITDTPGLIPYPHTIGSPAFAPNEEGAIKKTAIRIMEEQCHMQMDQIKEQITLLAKQADKIKTRMETSKAVYAAKMAFNPLVGETYYLYAREEDAFILSMIGPKDWGRKIPFKYYVATVKLLSDRTWEVIPD